MKRRGGWIAPRQGGYRPGGDFGGNSVKVKPRESVKPPPGNAGVVVRRG